MMKCLLMMVAVRSVSNQLFSNGDHDVIEIYGVNQVVYDYVDDVGEAIRWRLKAGKNVATTR